ncbi:hypothetical protein DC31_04440 [Microbacterium sp. CH12i]|nr:hypothetical protein DC31_04440 [Microbacterium sp. CH12i]
MRIWGIPHPELWKCDEPLDVIVPPDTAPPCIPGVKGRRLAAKRADALIFDGVPVVDPVAALFTCAGELTLDDAVVAIDALITTADDYPDLVRLSPLSTLTAITKRLELWGRFPGCGVIRRALPLARERVESPKETETRLLLRAAGLPEPVVQHEVRDHGHFVARVDLAYPESKIAIEYEGDGHRVDKKQWRIDIQRQRDLEDHGWIVIRLTEADLADGGATLLLRIRRALATRAR